MGVWMEDESTVMTVSQGINRPKGANAALNFFGRGNSRRAVGKQADGRQQFGLARRHHRQRLRRCVRKGGCDGVDGDEAGLMPPAD